jgi:multidrug resistance protein, MATE family
MAAPAGASPGGERAPVGDEGPRALLRLAGPLAAGYAGSTLLGFVDTAMVGRLGPEALAAVGIGNGIFFGLSIAGMGFIQGADPLIAQALGAGEAQQARRIFWQAVRLSLLLSLPLLALMALAALGLEAFGIDPGTAAATRRFLLGRGPNIVPFLLFAAGRSYLQATSTTRPIVLAMVIANVTNLLFNALLIFGDAALEVVHLPRVGLPALGVLGSGIASTLSAAFSLLVVVPAVRSIPVDDPAGARAWNAELFGKTLKVGTPIALQLGAEVGAFTLTTLMAGRMGRDTVAGHHVALSLVGFTFTVALGVASATSVLVGKAVGAGDTPRARRAGFTGVAFASGFMGFCALVFLAAPNACARLLTDEPAVIRMAVPLLAVAAAFQLSDGIQVVMAGALRGAGDTRFPQLANLVGHYAVGLPVAIGLGFFAHLGARGLWWGLSVGLSVVAVALFVRFDRISRRPIRRV